MWCVSRLLWSAGAGRFLFFAVGVKVRGGSVLSARSVAVLAILSASYLVVSGGLSLDVRLDLSRHCAIIKMSARRRTRRAGGLFLGVGALERADTLLLEQVCQTLAELFNGLALVGEHQEPKPFSRAGFLYEQFACAGRFHFHLFLSERLAAVRCSCGVFPLAMVLLYIVAQRYLIGILHKYCVTI